MTRTHCIYSGNKEKVLVWVWEFLPTCGGGAGGGGVGKRRRPQRPPHPLITGTAPGRSEETEDCPWTHEMSTLRRSLRSSQRELPLRDRRPPRMLVESTPRLRFVPCRSCESYIGGTLPFPVVPVLFPGTVHTEEETRGCRY